MKTKRQIGAAKAALTKKINSLEADLADVKNCIAKGWKFYLGGNIFAYKKELETAISELKVEQNNL